MTQTCADCIYGCLSVLYLHHYLFVLKSEDANRAVETSATDRQMLSSLFQFASRTNAAVLGFIKVL